MRKKKERPANINEQEQRLLDQLRRRPALMERFQVILALADQSEGPVKKADEVEALLMEEMRRLGHATLEGWAVATEQRLGVQVQQQESSAYVSKKKR